MIVFAALLAAVLTAVVFTLSLIVWGWLWALGLTLLPYLTTATLLGLMKLFKIEY